MAAHADIQASMERPPRVPPADNSSATPNGSPEGEPKHSSAASALSSSVLASLYSLAAYASQDDRRRHEARGTHELTSPDTSASPTALEAAHIEPVVPAGSDRLAPVSLALFAAAAALSLAVSLRRQRRAEAKEAVAAAKAIVQGEEEGHVGATKHLRAAKPLSTASASAGPGPQTLERMRQRAAAVEPRVSSAATPSALLRSTTPAAPLSPPPAPIPTSGGGGRGTISGLAESTRASSAPGALLRRAPPAVRPSPATVSSPGSTPSVLRALPPSSPSPSHPCGPSRPAAAAAAAAADADAAGEPPPNAVLFALNAFGLATALVGTTAWGCIEIGRRWYGIENMDDLAERLAGNVPGYVAPARGVAWRCAERARSALRGVLPVVDDEYEDEGGAGDGVGSELSGVGAGGGGGGDGGGSSGSSGRLLRWFQPWPAPPDDTVATGPRESVAVAADAVDEASMPPPSSPRPLPRALPLDEAWQRLGELARRREGWAWARLLDAQLWAERDEELARRRKRRGATSGAGRSEE